MLKPNQIPNTITTPTPEYPYGTLKDDIVPGDGAGSPIRKDYLQDLWSSHLEVVDRAAITPNGLPETAISNQFADALETIIDNHIDLTLIDNEHMADMPAQTIKGNDALSPADPQDLTVSEVKTLLALQNVTNESKATMLTNPALTGIPTTPTASASLDNTQVASTAFVHDAIELDTDYLKDFREYDATRPYTTNQPTFYAGVPYRALQATTNNQPDTSPSHWEVVGGAGGGSKNFLKNPLTKAVATDWLTTGAVGAWSDVIDIVADGAYTVPSFATGDTIDGTLNTVNASDGGQSWKIEFAYYIDVAGASYVEGNLQAVLRDETAGIDILGGNIPIVLGQVTKTAVFVYPGTNLSGLKLRIKCLANSGTFRIADVTVAPQQIMMVPAVGAWVPSLITMLNTPGTVYAKECRTGDSIAFDLTVILSGPVTNTIAIELPYTIDFDKLSGGYNAGYNAVLGTADAWEGSTHIFGEVSASSAVRTRLIIQVPNAGTQWTSSIPRIWANGHILRVRTTPIPITTLSNTVQVSGEDVEYYSHDGTSQVSGIGGSLIPNQAIGTQADRNMTINNARVTDSFDIESFINGQWIKVENLRPWSQQNTKSYGMRGFFTTPTNFQVQFGSGGTSSNGATFGLDGTTPWSILFSSGERWRVVKRSGGSLAQVPPVVRAEYTGSTAVVPSNGSWTTINYATNVEDTHKAVINASSDFTFIVPISGLYTIDHYGEAASVGDSLKYVLFDIGGSKSFVIGKIALVTGEGFNGGAHSGPRRYNAGETIKIRWNSGGVTVANLTNRRIIITRIGS